MKVNQPKKPDPSLRGISWNDIKEQEGVYTKVHTDFFRLIVLKRNGETVVLWWNPGQNVLDIASEVAHKDDRYHQVNEEVQFKVE